MNFASSRPNTNSVSCVSATDSGAQIHLALFRLVAGDLDLTGKRSLLKLFGTLRKCPEGCQLKRGAQDWHACPARHKHQPVETDLFSLLLSQCLRHRGPGCLSKFTTVLGEELLSEDQATPANKNPQLHRPVCIWRPLGGELRAKRPVVMPTPG